MKTVCQVCGALFIEDYGFVEPHVYPCCNQEYNWAWCQKVDDDYEREIPPDAHIDEYEYERAAKAYKEWAQEKLLEA